MFSIGYDVMMWSYLTCNLKYYPCVKIAKVPQYLRIAPITQVTIGGHVFWHKNSQCIPNFSFSACPQSIEQFISAHFESKFLDSRYQINFKKLYSWAVWFLSFKEISCLKTTALHVSVRDWQWQVISVISVT